MVSIKESRNKRSNIDVEGTIRDKSDPREVRTKYGSTNVCDAYVEDESGRIKISLWGDDIKKVENGDKVSIQGAYTNTFRNEIQLNIPKQSGKIEKIG